MASTSTVVVVETAEIDPRHAVLNLQLASAALNLPQYSISKKSFMRRPWSSCRAFKMA